MANREPNTSRYHAASATEAIKEIADSWKDAGMPAPEPVPGCLCAIPGCEKPSAVRIRMLDEDRLLCVIHWPVVRDLAQGTNPFP
jgi:hypothetical protein